jgi:hypothetical protein
MIDKAKDNFTIRFEAELENELENERWNKIYEEVRDPIWEKVIMNVINEQVYNQIDIISLNFGKDIGGRAIQKMWSELRQPLLISVGQVGKQTLIQMENQFTCTQLLTTKS